MRIVGPPGVALRSNNPQMAASLDLKMGLGPNRWLDPFGSLGASPLTG